MVLTWEKLRLRSAQNDGRSHHLSRPHNCSMHEAEIRKCAQFIAETRRTNEGRREGSMHLSAPAVDHRSFKQIHFSRCIIPAVAPDVSSFQQRLRLTIARKLARCFAACKGNQGRRRVGHELLPYEELVHSKEQEQQRALAQGHVAVEPSGGLRDRRNDGMRGLSTRALSIKGV